MPSTPFKYAQQLSVTPTLSSGSSTAVSLPSRSQFMKVTFLIGFTKGSLTSVTVTPQVTYDGTTWHNVTEKVLTKTANENFAISLDATGCKQVRIAYTTSGTTTSSVLTVDAVTQAA